MKALYWVVVGACTLSTVACVYSVMAGGTVLFLAIIPINFVTIYNSTRTHLRMKEAEREHKAWVKEVQKRLGRDWN